MKAVQLESHCVVDVDGRASNFASAMARGYPVATKNPGHTRKLAIIGSGPSVRDYLDELKSWDGDIWAVNGAYDYLQDQGIVPHGFVGMDPLPGLAEYVTRPRQETTFYIASFCDPSVFDKLAGHNVVLWHPEDETTPYPDGHEQVQGGTTVLTRAPFLANLIGWRDITLYGVDSSFDFEAGPYCYEWGTYGCDISGQLNKVMVNDEGPFLTELGMLKQVSQLGIIHQTFRGMLKIRCGGLMDAYLRAPTMDDSEIEVAKLDAA